MSYQQGRIRAEGTVKAARTIGAEAGTAGAIVRAVRWQAGLSQRELARRAGLARTTVERIEANDEGAEPRWSTMQRLLAAAGLRLVVLPGDDQQRTRVVWHEYLRDRGGRHFPAHLPVVRVCLPHYDWSQGGRYMSWSVPPAPAYSYWRRPVQPLQPHILDLKVTRHFSGRCYCAYLERQNAQWNRRQPP